MTTTTSQAVVLQELIAQATQDLEEIGGVLILCSFYLFATCDTLERRDRRWARRHRI